MASTDIDEINKIRKAVGLPLLPSASTATEDGPAFKEHESSDDSEAEPASTLETREAAGYENFKQVQDEERRRIEREKRKQQIQKARDAAARFSKLEGAGLGDSADGNDLDAKAWLRGSKKRQAKIEKERAEKLAEELAERERLAAVEYTSSDLAGVRVAHEVGDFDTGESEQVLTLQDTEVGKDDASDEEDVLENAEIVAKDKLKDKLDLKKKRTAYDVHQDGGEGGLLSQYDEKKRKAFTLDNYGSSVEERDAKRLQIGDQLRNTISLDILKPEATSDYMEIKVKKPKKSKKKSTRHKFEEDEEDIFTAPKDGSADAMEVDQPVANPSTKAKAKDTTFNDDEDLANALSFSRRAALKKQKRKAEDIVKQLREEADDTPTADLEGGLTVDDTTNFLDNLSSRPRDESPKPVVHKSIEQEEAPSPDRSSPGDADQVMAEAYSGVENEEELLERLRREQSTHTPDISHSGLNEEQTLDQGLGAALGLLKQRGLVKDANPDDKNSLYKDRQKFIIEARLREHENEQRARLQRERERQSGKLSGMSAREREDHARWQNTQREHQSSIQAAASFNRDYKPDVQIKYVDDDGRLMNQKEAFKRLSHQFHGKGSGKLKTEKHLKKLEDEKRRLATSVLDSSQATGMEKAAGTQSKKLKEAGVRLA